MTTSHSPERRRILFMDDESSVLRVGTMVLEHLGYDVVGVPQGEAAVSAYKNAEAEGAPFDAVILDLRVKRGMGGIDTAAALKSLNPRVKVIVSSGNVGEDDVSLEEHGFVDRVNKPYEIATLQNVLRRTLEN
jgi:CheY-like chemotaxis protein